MYIYFGLNIFSNFSNNKKFREYGEKIVNMIIFVPTRLRCEQRWCNEISGIPADNSLYSLMNQSTGTYGRVGNMNIPPTIAYNSPYERDIGEKEDGRREMEDEREERGNSRPET